MRALRRGTFCALMLVAVSAAQTQVAAQAGRAQAIELTGEPATATSVRLRWRIVNPGVIGGIQVQRARPTAPSLYSVLATLPANATTHLDAGLQPGEIWIYRVLTIGMRTAQPSSSNSVWVKLPAARCMM